MESPFELFARLGSVALKRTLATSSISIVERLDFPILTAAKVDGKLEFSKRSMPLELKDRVLDAAVSAAMDKIAGMSEMIQEGKCYDFAYQTDPIVLSYEKKLEGGLAYVCERRKSSFVYSRNPFPVKSSCLWTGTVSEETAAELVTLFSREASEPIKPGRILVLVGAKPLLNENPDKPIRSIMLRIGSWNPDVVQIEDPLYESLRASEVGTRDANDMYGIVLADFIEHVETEGLLDRLPCIGESVQEKHMNCVSFLCKSFIDSKSSQYDSEDLGKSNLDKNLLPSFVRESIQSGPGAKIFQMIASSIYSDKKKPTGTVTEAMVSNLGHIRNRITKAITKDKNGLMTYNDYLLTK